MINRTLINQLRAVCAAIAVLAFFVYLNTSRLYDESEASMHSVGALNTDVTQVLQTRQGQVVTTAWVEYLALLAAGYAVALAVGAPRLAKLRSAGR